MYVCQHIILFEGDQFYDEEMSKTKRSKRKKEKGMKEKKL